MRTRRSNRTKRYTEELDVIFVDEHADDPLARRQKRAEDQDANFDGDTVNNIDDDASHDESNAESEEEESVAALEEEEEVPVQAKVPPRRVKPKGPFQLKSSSRNTSYSDIEPIVTDSHMPRGYAGSFDRYIRGMSLVRAWYGPRKRSIETALRLLDRWIDWTLLPPRETANAAGCKHDIWNKGTFEGESQYVEEWLARLKADEPQGTILSPLSEEESEPYRLQPGTLPVLMGPHASQKEFKFTTGESRLLGNKGLPIDDDNVEETGAGSGWIFDTGGIVLSLDWANRRGRDTPQLLALAVIPHDDQENYNYEVEVLKPDFQRHGTVQIWEFLGQTHEPEDSIRPAGKSRLLKTLCLDTGRARRVKWSPACDHLAVLSGDGGVDILEPYFDNGDAAYGKKLMFMAHYTLHANDRAEKVHRPLASFILDDGVKATAMTWVNFNRLVVGYSDGSIALWSVHPNRLLSRHPVHHSSIIGMASGYPTLPYLIATTPIGGDVKLTDLRSPSCETTEVPCLSVLTTPNLLSWSEHLLGFFTLYPSSNVLNTTVGFMHHAYFPITRRAYYADSFVTAISVGRTHPFLLVGTADGSLGALNTQCEIFQLLRGRRGVSDRIRIFQHEHRPREHFDADNSPAAERGASRILHGFYPQKNRHANADGRGSGRKRRKKEEDDYEEEEEANNEETIGPVDPSRGIVYEALTRIAAVEWNPNEGYGCWAAAAMGSGLVKVMDLGLDRPEDDTK
jgi:transcription factor C subunit 6